MRFIGDRQEDILPPFEPTLLDFLGVCAGSNAAKRSDRGALAIVHMSNHAFSHGTTFSEAMFIQVSLSVRAMLGLGAACISTDTRGASPYTVSIGKIAASTREAQAYNQTHFAEVPSGHFLTPSRVHGVDPSRSVLPIHESFWHVAQPGMATNDKEAIEQLQRGSHVPTESLISVGMAATAMIAGQTVISGSAYALFRSFPQDAQEAISSELLMAKLTRAAINVGNQQAALGPICWKNRCKYQDTGKHRVHLRAWLLLLRRAA